MMTDKASCPVDVIYIAACSRDLRLARICIASIRHFYPEVPIRILAGDNLPGRFVREMARYWQVGMADVPAGEYGWGYVKLEPLFGPKGERFMVCDADTAFSGRVLDIRASSDAPFLVDNEQLPDAELKRLYFDWDRLAAIDPQARRALGAFNVGQWFGEAGLLSREDFDPWLEWTFPRLQRYPDCFMGGDQGVMNHVLLKKEALEGLSIARAEIMRWPGHGMDDLGVQAVHQGSAPPRVVHWAGMKSILLRNMTGGELLQYFEDVYFARLPLGRVRHRLALWSHVWTQLSHKTLVPLRLFLGKWRGHTVPARQVTGT